MDFPDLTILSILILFVSTLTRSTLGFGDALVAMPLLTMAIGVREATPLVGIVAPTIAITVVWRNWRSVDLHTTWRLVLASLVGIPFGLFILKLAPEALISGLLGLFLLAYGVYSLAKPELVALERRGWVYLFGFVAGVLGSAYNANGPPVVVYGALRRWPPERFRATLQGYFLPTGLLIMLGHAASGLWSARVLQLYGLALPAVFVAIFVGERLSRRISVERFKRIVFVVLIVLGTVMLARAVLS